MKKLPYILIAVLSFTCCVRNSEQQENQENDAEAHEPFVINPRDFEKNNLLLSEFVEDIKYIPLSNEFPIGNIEALRVTPNAIYLVYDESRGGEGNGRSQLFRFDINGNNPVQIGRVGKGPHEYLLGLFFAVDETNNRIYISGLPNIIMVFDTSGHYIREFKIQHSEQIYPSLEVLGSNKLLLPQSILGAQGRFLWNVIDTLGNVLSSKINSTLPFKTHAGPQSGTFKYGDKILYWINYNDTIFEISPDLTYHASYIIAPDEPRVDERKEQTMVITLGPSEYYSPHYFTETRNYLINRYSYKGEYAVTFIEKDTRRALTASGTKGIENDLDNGLAFVPSSYFTDGKNEYLTTIIQPFALKIHVASDEFANSTAMYPEKKTQLQQLANSLNEDDNPILMMVKLQK